MCDITSIVLPSLGAPHRISAYGQTAPWLHLPIEVSDDDASTLVAGLLPLARGQAAYVELSERPWDGGLPQFEFACRRGSELRLPGSNKYFQGAAYILYRTLAIIDVVAALRTSSRLRFVLAVGGNLDVYAEALAQVYRAPEWNPHAASIDVLASDDHPRADVEAIARQYGIPMIAVDEGDGFEVVKLMAAE